MRTRIQRLAMRLGLASGLSAAAWWLALLPISSGSVRAGASVAWRVLDAPVSALNLLYPEFLRSGFAKQFEGGISGCFLEASKAEFARYLCVGVPAWLAVLYAPGLARSVAKYFAARYRKAHAKERQFGV